MGQNGCVGPLLYSYNNVNCTGFSSTGNNKSSIRNESSKICK